jgi:hypothetical protein
MKAVFAAGICLASLMSGSAQADDVKADLAICKMESMRVIESLSLQYVRDCMNAKHYDFTAMPTGCVVYGQALGMTGGYEDKRLAVEQTTHDCFQKR